LVGQKRVPWKGVVTPEKIGQDPQLFGFILSRLRARGLRLTIQMRNLGS